MELKAFRLPTEMLERLAEETKCRRDWTEADVAREAMNRGLESMARERKRAHKTRKKT